MPYSDGAALRELCVCVVCVYRYLHFPSRGDGNRHGRKGIVAVRTHRRGEGKGPGVIYQWNVDFVEIYLFNCMIYKWNDRDSVVDNRKGGVPYKWNVEFVGTYLFVCLLD